MIEIVGVPFDLGGLREGSRMGPAALRMAGLVSGLKAIGRSVRDAGDTRSHGSRTNPKGMRNFPPLLDTLRELRAIASAALSAGHIPLVLGGDHSIAPGAISAALAAFEGDLVLLWIDAHADVNTPGTSSSGNVHGMPVAALQALEPGLEGVRATEWDELRDVLDAPPLRPDRTAWLGLRDVDLEERPRVHSGLGLTMTDVDRRGLAACVDRFDEFVRASGARHLWVSFDVDVLDPVLAPGTGTAVRGGLTYREGHLLAELLRERIDAGPYRLVGVDVVETNPLVDTSNATAKMAVEWTLSLFGKTIL